VKIVLCIDVQNYLVAKQDQNSTHFFFSFCQEVKNTSCCCISVHFFANKVDSQKSKHFSEVDKLQSNGILRNFISEQVESYYYAGSVFVMCFSDFSKRSDGTFDIFKVKYDINARHA